MRQKLIFHPYTVNQNKEYGRFLSHGFIHSNMTHLIVNLIVLYQIGSIVETYYNSIFGPVMGPVAFVLLYLSSIIIASVPSYFQHQDNPAYAALGASGATSALVFAFILFDPWAWFLFPPLPALILGIAYLWYSNYMDKRGTDNIGHNAHFWGAVYGLVFTIIAIQAFQPTYMRFFWSKLMAGPTPPPFF